MDELRCVHCDQLKPLDQFYRDKHKKTGHKPRCKPCDLLSRDKQKRATYEKEYWDKRRAERREIVRESHRRNKEHHKKIRKIYLATENGKAVHRKHGQTRRARYKNAFVEAVDPKSKYIEQNGICYLCGGKFSFDEMHLDHVVPLARGGLHEKTNTKMACASCNLTKGTREVCYQMV